MKKYNNYESHIYNKHYLSTLKKVVYTALLGKYDKIHQINKEKGYDYFMFTDQDFDNQSNCNWTILHLKKTDNLDNKNIFKLQRFYKTHPHLFFADYDLSIYVDSSYGIKGNLDEFLLRILSPNISIYNNFYFIINYLLYHKNILQTNLFGLLYHLNPKIILYWYYLLFQGIIIFQNWQVLFFLLEIYQNHIQPVYSYKK